MGLVSMERSRTEGKRRGEKRREVTEVTEAEGPKVELGNSYFTNVSWKNSKGDSQDTGKYLSGSLHAAVPVYYANAAL